MIRATVCVLCIATLARAQDSDAHKFERVEFTLNNVNHLVFGDVLVEAQDGGILLEAKNQTIWPLQPNAIRSREVLENPLRQLSKEDLAAEVLKELPRGFRVYETNHYVICYNTSRGYAEWAGALFERLHRAFNNYWTRRGIQLEETPPLVACVFRDKKSYEAYGRQELGKNIESILGYYSFSTNRIAMYDLLEGRRYGSLHQINSLLRTERTVATVIHEATHQIAFNSGLHQRFAAIPLWLNEGLAIYFETPDLSSYRGWKTIGKVNQVRLGQFRKYARQREADSLLSLISSDARFRQPGLATEAYAESWAFCYFLIRTHPKEFAEYLKLLQKKEPLGEDSPQQRINDFTQVFGKLPHAMNADLLKLMSRVR